jgi:hypothetical protein
MFVERLRLFGQATLRRSISEAASGYRLAGSSAGGASTAGAASGPLCVGGRAGGNLRRITRAARIVAGIVEACGVGWARRPPLTPCVPAPRRTPAIEAFRVVLAEDALCSSSDAGHDALMTLYRTRFSEQIEIIKTEELPGIWREQS